MTAAVEGRLLPRTLLVFVNYQSVADVARAIETITSNVRESSLEIVVVDNSPEPECEVLADEHGGVTIVRTGRNMGFAGGCNAGVQAAQREWDYLLLMNPDAYCTNDFLSPMVVAMQSDSAWGIVTPKIVRGEPNGAVWFAGSELRWYRGGARHVYDSRFEDEVSPVKVPFASGCCMLIKRATWDVVGRLDDSYFLYFEDTDFVERVKRAGYSIGYMPKVTVVHEESKSTGYQSPLFLYYFGRNRVLYLKRWAPRFQFYLFMLYDIIVKVPGSWIVFALMRGRWRNSLAFCSGTLDGILGKTGKTDAWHR